MNDEIQKNQYQLKRTGLIYDPIMLEFHNLWDPIYPEKPERIKMPYERCEFYGLTKDCIRIPGRFCTDEEVQKCHTERVNRLMRDCENMNYDELKHLSTQYDSMFFHQCSDKAARFALGSSIQLMDEIMSDKLDNGFAIIRPPGHHAMHDEPNGYCYFNNASIVAKLAIEKYNLQRVLIVDWDVHHGQGTQYLFYDDPKVLYFSLHRYDYGNFWPNLRQSDFDYIGEKEGKGYNINIPLNKTGFGNSEYAAAIFNILLPIAYEYKPELVIISSGYDSAIGCFEGRMKVTPAAYGHFINILSCLSNSKLCVLLEGGYCLKSLSEGVALSVRSLLGYPCPRIEDFEKPDPVFVQTMLNLISVLRPYWKCLQDLNDIDETTSLETYLKNWNENYRKDINFYDYDKRPEEFALTGFYPLYPDEENERLDKVIDELIKSTDLAVPNNKICFSLDDEQLNRLKLSNQRCDRILSTGGHSILDLVENLANKKFTSGFTVVKSGLNLEEIALNAISKFENIKKVLNVKFDNTSPESGKSESNSVLNFNLGYETDSPDWKTINLKFDNDAGYITAFLRILLPISYHFNPDLVILNISSNFLNNEKPTLSEISFEHIIRMLSSLANGNLVLVLEEIDSKSDILNEKLNKFIGILDGHSCTISPKLIPDQETRRKIKDKIGHLKQHWECFQFNEKLPN